MLDGSTHVAITKLQRILARSIIALCDQMGSKCRPQAKHTHTLNDTHEWRGAHTIPNQVCGVNVYRQNMSLLHISTATFAVFFYSTNYIILFFNDNNVERV